MKFRTITALLLGCASAAPGFALDPGRIDPSFGVGGRQLIAVDLEAAGSINATASAVDAEGRVYLVGSEVAGASIVVARLLPNGAIDHDFGDDGLVRYLPPGIDALLAHGVALDAAGQPIVVGEGVFAGGDGMIACRFDTAGNPDLSFGVAATPGCLTVGLLHGSAEDVLVQNLTGRVILAGTFTNNGKTRGVVVGLQPNGGGVDGTFGEGFGLQFVPPQVTNPTTFRAIAQDVSGGLAMAGSLSLAGSDKDLLAFRLDSSGKRDLAFNGTGIAIVSVDLFGSGVDEATSVALLDDGKMLLAGYAESGPVALKPVLAKLDTNGNLDPGFAFSDDVALLVDDGLILYEFCDVCDMRPQDMTVMPDGKIVVTGSLGVGVDDDGMNVLVGAHDFFAMRLLPDGARDTQFQSAGSAFAGLSVTNISALTASPQDSAFSLAVQGEKIIVSGFTHADSVLDDATPDYNFSAIRLGNSSPLFNDGFED